MWCPLGYVTLPRIYEACEQAAIDALKNVSDLSSVPGRTPFRVFHDAISDLDDDPVLRRDEVTFAVHGKIFFEALEAVKFDTTACSPDGKLLKVGSLILRPPIYNHWYQISSEYRKRPELMCIDVHMGVIDLRNIDRRMLDWWGDDFPPGWQAKFIDILAHLDGWSICFPEALVDLSMATLTKYWRPLNDNDLSVVGRPRERDKVGAAYAKAFPDGHGNMTYKQVLAELERSAGIQTSADTLRRALGSRE